MCQTIQREFLEGSRLKEMGVALFCPDGAGILRSLRECFRGIIQLAAGRCCCGKGARTGYASNGSLQIRCFVSWREQM